MLSPANPGHGWMYTIGKSYVLYCVLALCSEYHDTSPRPGLKTSFDAIDRRRRTRQGEGCYNQNVMRTVSVTVVYVRGLLEEAKSEWDIKLRESVPVAANSR